MHVVNATIEDAPEIAEIHVEAWRTAYISIVPTCYLASLSIKQHEDMWRECIVKGTPELLVAKQAGIVQGWLSFGKRRDKGLHEKEAEVWALYVSPRAWSTGVGRILWQRAKELMLEQGFTFCSLWVFPQNYRAIKFYRAVGFNHDGAAPKNFELGGAQLQEVRLVSQLDG